MHEPRIFHHEFDGRDCTCITIGSSETKISGYLLQGKKQYGYIFRDGELTSWTWNGLSVIGDERCICFDRLEIYSIWELFSSRRGDALAVVRDLATACSLLSAEFLALESGIIPLWRLYGIEGGGVLIMPQNVGDLITSSVPEEERKRNFMDWVHWDIHPPFSLCDEFTQFLYAAASGFPPLASDDVREVHCAAIPLASMRSTLAPPTISFIDETLHLSLTKQRDIAGNWETQEALKWFLEKTKNLEWGEPEVDLESGEYLAFQAKLARQASRKVFWRKKGWLVSIIVISVALVSYFTYGRVKLALTPPYTLGMSEEEIIDEYFQGQTDLDSQKLTASLAPHVKSPAELEVANLFVTRQARQAYEAIEAIVSVTDWIASGKPAIAEGAGIYGITDVSVREIDGDTWETDSVIWTPYPYEEERAEEKTREGFASVYTYRQRHRFVFETNKRGWRLIKSIENIDYSFLERIEVPTFRRNNTLIPGAGKASGREQST